MLTTLRIKNLALVADLTLELKPGYNTITGETGAGKSILIGALNLVLGERADRTLIRTGADACVVEAHFDVSCLKPQFHALLEENGLEPCEGGQLFLKRSFTLAGANRQFVNGSPATLSVLAGIGQWLVDIHGPHEHQSLLNPVHQLAILDAFGQLDSPRQAFADLVRRRKAIEAEKVALVVDERTYAQQLDLLRFQVGEISAARLRPGEEDEIESDHKRAANATRLIELSSSALDILSEAETSIQSQATVAGRALQELHRLDPGSASLIEMLELALSNLNDLQAELDRYREKIEVDPARLKELEERMDLLHSLRRKYGSSIADVIQFGAEAARKLESLEQRDAELERINSELKKLQAGIWKAGQTLSDSRRKILPQIGARVRKQLEALGFKRARFEVSMQTRTDRDSGERCDSFNSTGLDTVEFQFAPNPGEPARALRAIASSGELARVMLALKTVLADQDEIPVLIFDEVDANVGGETAQAIGEKMREIARRRQVLCITHSAHVAAPASAHFVVNKNVRDGRTLTEVKSVEGEERVAELSRMLGGQTDAARRHAEALLK
jgi:DNA repair protein RecN (Recombination protein N)